VRSNLLSGLSADTTFATLAHLVGVRSRAFDATTSAASGASHQGFRVRSGFVLGHATGAEEVEYPRSPTDPSAFSGFCHVFYLLSLCRTPG
jgi:hypothetical protein